MSMDDLKCWNCGADLSGVPQPISRHEQCPDCFEALHCCRLCEHSRVSEPDHCTEERADPPVIKENANFCEWFHPTSDAFSGMRVNRKDDARGKLDALFGGGEPDSDRDADSDTDAETGTTDSTEPEIPNSRDAAAKARLDDLFTKR